jgi:hypothetical protein
MKPEARSWKVKYKSKYNLDNGKDRTQIFYDDYD